MRQDLFHKMLGVGEGVFFFMFSFIFAPLGNSLNMTYGELGDILTLCLQGLSVMYVGFRIINLKKDKDGNHYK